VPTTTWRPFWSKTSASDGIVVDAVRREIDSSTVQEMPGLSSPSGLGTSISVSSVLLPGCNPVAIRVTLPANVRPGISRTRISAATPGPTPNASSCGTNTWVRITSECISVNMKVDPADTRLPLSTLRCVTTPSNGATTRW
jgi:hypothetical protein